MSSYSVVMFVSSLSSITTGSMRYSVEVYKYLKRSAVSVSVINLEEMPILIKRCPLFLNLILTNFWFIRRLLSLRLDRNSNVILFEDYHFHPRLFLFNLLVKTYFKKASVLSTAHHLSLSHHPALRSNTAKKIDEFIIRIFFKQSDKILVNSDNTKNEVLSLGIEPSKVEKIYISHEDMFLGYVSQKPECSQDGRLNLLFVGRCHADKGLEYLLEAIGLLGDDIVLNIVGDTCHDPEYYKKLVEIVRKLKIEEKIFFHGYIDKEELKQFCQGADIFVLPSVVEGFGAVLLEVMSAGLPIVASNVGGIPELIKDGYNGVLVPPKEGSSLANAINSLIRSPSLRKQYGMNGYEYFRNFRDLHSWDSTCKKIHDILSTMADAA